MEVWLEPLLDGVILNYFLHAEPAGVAAWQLARMNLAKINHQRRVAGKRMAFEVKPTLEASRPVGCPRPPDLGQSQSHRVDFRSMTHAGEKNDRKRPRGGHDGADHLH